MRSLAWIVTLAVALSMTVPVDAPGARARVRHLERPAPPDDLGGAQDPQPPTGRSAHHCIEEVRPLVPPVAEELGVVGADDDRRTVHLGGQVPDLLLAIEHEVAGVHRRLLHGPGPHVGLLVGEIDTPTAHAIR